MVRSSGAAACVQFPVQSGKVAVCVRTGVAFSDACDCGFPVATASPMHAVVASPFVFFLF